MTNPPINLITPQCQPVFPCWLWKNDGHWYHYDRPWCSLNAVFTHWSPDAPTAPSEGPDNKGPHWCAMCGKWGDHSSGTCPELKVAKARGMLGDTPENRKALEQSDPAESAAEEYAEQSVKTILTPKFRHGVKEQIMTELLPILHRHYAPLVAELARATKERDEAHYQWSKNLEILSAVAELSVKWKVDRAALEAELAELKRSIICEGMDPNGTIWEHADKVQKENTALRTRLAQLEKERAK